MPESTIPQVVIALQHFNMKLMNWRKLPTNGNFYRANAPRTADVGDGGRVAAPPSSLKMGGATEGPFTPRS
jgi:hypothetical protein